jgi:four helix bundle protein
MVKSYKDLEVWQLSIELTNIIYDMCLLFPDDERYDLSSKMKRSVVSVPSNISESAGHTGTKEFINFLRIAKGSLAELETQLIISNQRDFINNENYISLNEKVSLIDRMLFGLISSLQKKLV